MAFLTGYFDESAGKTHCSVGGFIGESEQLIGMESEWRLLLQESGLTHFHMKDYAHSNGEFKPWRDDKARRREFMRRAIGILKRRARVVIGVVIDKAGFHSAYGKSEVYPRLYKNEYAAASLMSLIKCSSWAQRAEVASPLMYMFDAGNPKRTDFQSGFDAVRANPHLTENDHHFGSLTFADDKVAIPLQLADLIAYELNKFCTDEAEGASRLRASLGEIMKMPNHVTVATPALLDRIAEKTKSRDGPVALPNSDFR